MRISHVIKTDQWRSDPQISPTPHFVVYPPQYYTTTRVHQGIMCAQFSELASVLFHILSVLSHCWLGNRKVSQPVKNVAPTSLKSFIFGEIHWGPGLTWSDIWKISHLKTKSISTFGNFPRILWEYKHMVPCTLTYSPDTGR